MMDKSYLLAVLAQLALTSDVVMPILLPLLHLSLLPLLLLLLPLRKLSALTALLVMV